MVIRHESDLKTACKEWQEILRLRDWHIDVRFARVADIGGKFAESRVHSLYRTARILIGRPDELGEDWLGSHDIEVTLVHELVHCYTDAMGNFEHGTVGYVGEESLCESLAQALVGLRRNAQSKTTGLRRAKRRCTNQNPQES